MSLADFDSVSPRQASASSRAARLRALLRQQSRSSSFLITRILALLAEDKDGELIAILGEDAKDLLPVCRALRDFVLLAAPDQELPEIPDTSVPTE